MRRVKILHEELSYKIRGVLFQVHNELGRFRNEKQYGDAIENCLKKLKLPYIREMVLPVSFEGEKAGRNRIDFIVEDKIIIEVKSEPSFTRDDYSQCKRYLVSSDKELCLLVNFGLSGCVIKRVLSPKLLITDNTDLRMTSEIKSVVSVASVDK